MLNALKNNHAGAWFFIHLHWRPYLMIATVWQQFLTIIKEEVGSRVVETWLKAVVLTQWDPHAKVVYLKAPNAFVKDWITSNYLHLFHLHLGRLFHEKNIKIVFLDDSKNELVIKPARQAATQDAVVLDKRDAPPVVKNSPKAGINLQFQFDSFVVGPNNELAYAAALAITAKPGVLYNPLFMYGASGLGKTHLLHAIANQIRLELPTCKMIYQSADRFVNEFINAIRFDKVAYFEQKYKDIDLLLIDDIQFISNKEQTQEAFFHIFNALYDARKQIVVTSDSMPSDIQGLANRLRSRLDGGLIVDIHPPTLETKIAILKKKAELHHEHLSDEVSHYLAQFVHANVRELEGLLIRILAFASLTHQPISLELAQKVLSRSIKEQTPKAPQAPQLAFIASCVAHHYATTVAELRSYKRDKTMTLARHTAMYLMKKLTGVPLNQIALFWSRKDHSTVIHAVEKIEQQASSNASFSLMLAQLEKKVMRVE